MPVVAVARVHTVVDEDLLQALREIIHGAEVVVVPAARIGPQQRKERMMKIVAPLRVHAVAVRFARTHELRIVQVALRDQHEPAPKRCTEPLHLRGELLHEVDCGAINVLVRRVEPQTVNVIVPQPHHRVVAEKPANLVASTFVEVHRRAPRCVKPLRQVRSELIGVVPHRTEVVVDHIEDHREILRVARVDEALESVRSTVRLKGSKQEDPVVTPAALSGELVHRHHLQVRDAEICQVVQMVDRAIEGSFLAEGSDVHLVDDCCGKRRRVPVLVRPPKGTLVIDP